MAFNAANLSRWSPFNQTGPHQFGYFSSTDNVATVSASTYFTPFADSFSQALLPAPFSVGDTIQCTCTDGNVAMTITSITPIATTEETETIVIGPNSVNTAAIQAQAVTAAKIANGTITTTQISNTAGITGTQIAATTIAAANIVNATITTTQISATAGILGSQLAASAAIAGTQLAANTVASSNIAANTVQYIKVPVTLVAFLANYGTPVPIIALVASSTIIIDSWAFVWNYGSAALVGGGCHKP